MKPRVILLAAAAVAALSLSAQTPSAAPSGRMALVGATVHPVAGPDIPAGVVVVHGTKIESVSAGPAPAGVRVVDLSGKHLYPSLIATATQLGLVEISAVRASVDTTEIGEINPEARADLAVNFDSEILPVTRSSGVLVAGITPIGGIVSGAVSALKLDGWTREDTALRSPAAVTVFWPNLRVDRSPDARFSARVQEKRRDESLRRLKEAFAAAKAYGKARDSESGTGVPRHDADPKMEALRPAVEGKIPVFVVANTLAQIKGALAWAKEGGLKIVIVGGQDAWRAAGEIAAAGVPVVVDPVIGLPARNDEPYDAPFTNAGALAKAGVRVAISEGDSQFVRNIAHHAGVAAAYGLPRDKALEAITLEPARILGIDDRVGSIAAGKDATMIVTDGDVLDFRHRVLAAYLDGRELDLSDKHKRLYERYRNRPTPGPAR
jgi:imidazolonepropionase-like amidohydrolase